MQKPTVNKPYSYHFDNTTMYNIKEKIDIDLITEKFYRSLRPKAVNPLGEPMSKPHKNLSMPFFDPGTEVVRSDINKTKKIPHKDYIPVYVPPYYNIKETGFHNMNHDNIFRSE